MAIHNPTHRGLDWLLRGVLPAHDYTVVIRQARRPPGETPTYRGNRWPDPLPGPPTNDQETLLLEADTQSLIETILDAFLPQVNWSRVELLNYILRKKENIQKHSLNGLCKLCKDTKH